MKKVAIFILLLCCCNIASAQKEEKQKSSKEITPGPYLVSPFRDNWSLGVAVGTNLYHGEDDNKGSFLKRFAPKMELSLTKGINPILNLRGNISVGKAFGWSSVRNDFAVVKDGDLYKHNFNVITGNLDLMFNISNAIGGYKVARTWDFIPYIGMGAALAWTNLNTNREYIASAGLLNNIRLSPRVTMTLEYRQMLVNSRFNEMSKRLRLYEGMSSFSIGISVKLGKHGYKQAKMVDMPDYSTYVQKIDTLRSHNMMIINENDSLRRMTAQLLNEPKDSAQDGSRDTISGTSVTPVMTPHTMLVNNKAHSVGEVILFFPINSSHLEVSELASLDIYMQHALKATPDKIYILIGSSDIDTGNRKINQQLSEQRVDAVHKLLITKYKIPRDRLIKHPEGDRNNRFSESSLNRSVIIE